MGFEFPDEKNNTGGKKMNDFFDEDKMKSLATPPPPVEKPKVYPINTMKIKSLDDVKILLAVLGLASTKEFAKENNIEHLLDD